MMDFINEIKDDTLIICNKYVKDSIMRMNKLLPIKFIYLNEFLNKYFFSYDEESILYVMDKYHVKYEIAKEYLDNLYCINDIEYNNEKLDFLVSLKKDVDNSHLLKYDNSFKNYLSKVKIIVCGVEINRFLKRVLDNYEYREVLFASNDYKHLVYEFDTMEDEIYYVASEIATLIDKGILPNKIKLMNVDSSYSNTINRIFSLFNLKNGLKHKRVLASYPLIKEFISIYKDNTLDETINMINHDDNMYDELIKVINKYIKYDNKELIIYKLEHSYFESNVYDNEIEVVDYLEYIPKDNEYYFLINFNEKMIPKYYMDTEYLTDNIKEVLDIETSKELNKKLKNIVIDKIKNIKNLVITYKLRDTKSSYYPSSLVSNYEVKRIDTFNNISYSRIYNEMNLTREYDNYIKYGTKSDLFKILNNNYEIKYNSFINKYNKIDRVMDKLNLSYSKMQTYNKCAFRYYLSDILKLDIFEENFSTVIGSMVHYVMEKCLSNNDIDIDKYVSEYLVDKILTKKEQFFLEKYKKEIHELINQVMMEKEYSSFDKAMYEKRIDIDYGNNIHFIGVIDKILYVTDGLNTYIALIDYKTGNDDISLKYLKYGINIQLPIYLYLSNELEFINPKYTGFYLQKFNINDKDYRLVGYSNSDKDVLEKLDNNYNNSKIIKGLKTLKDGSFAKTSKVLSNDDMDKIKDVVSSIINNVIDKIKNNSFEINPKVDNDKNLGCEYCKFNDICFKRKEDEVRIDASEFGGDTL